MAQIKVSALPEAATAVDTMEVEVNDTGTSRRLTLARIVTMLGLGGLATKSIIDEDNMASDLADRPPSQQSVKAYIAAQIAAIPVPGAWTWVAPVTASGTAVEFTGIPPGVREIRMLLERVSFNAGDHALVQLGSASAYSTGGYQSGSEGSTSSSGFLVNISSDGRTCSGIVDIINTAGTDWVSAHGITRYSTNGTGGGGHKDLGDTLTRVRLTRTGIASFDGGTVALMYR